MGALIRYCDDFYPDPDLVRAVALRSAYHVPKGLYGLRSTEPVFPKGVKDRIRTAFGFDELKWHDLGTSTGRFFQSLSESGERSAFFAHTDSAWFPSAPSFALVVYLTPNAPPTAGTVVVQHRATGVWHWPTAADARRLGVPLEDLRKRLLDDSGDRRKWLTLDRCRNVYNRAVLFPGHWYHSGNGVFGRTLATGRLYQAFFFTARPYTFPE